MGYSARLIAGVLWFSLIMPATGLTGIWTGQLTGRNDEKLDVAFQFKLNKDLQTGVMFGDEFDLPVEDLKVSGDSISFSITTTNYYDGRRTKFVFTGTIGDKEMQLTRERTGAPAGGNGNNKQDAKQTFTLKKLA